MALALYHPRISERTRRAWDLSEPATHGSSPRSHDLAPPPPLPPSPGTAALPQSALFTLTDHLDLILTNPRQRARGFEVASQLPGQNARRKRDLGTTAIATIGQPHKR